MQLCTRSPSFAGETPALASSNHRITAELESFLNAGFPDALVVAEHGPLLPSLGSVVPFPRLSLTIRGLDEMQIDKNGHRIKIHSKYGEAVFLPSNVWNLPMWTHPVKVLHFLFGSRHIGISLVEHDGFSKQPNTVIRASFPSSSGVLQKILSAMEQLEKGPCLRQISLALTRALILAMAGIVRKPGLVKTRKRRQTYDNVCLYLQEHFHEPLTRQSVADIFAINPNHLSRLFRQEGLMRFNDYLILLRIERAKYLLRNHNLKLDDLAQSCGFQDTSYFCKVFKFKTNRTPGYYRVETRPK